MDEFLRIRKWKKYLFRAPSPLMSGILILLLCVIYPIDWKSKLMLFFLIIFSSIFLFLIFELSRNYFPIRRTFLLNFLSFATSIPPAYIYKIMNILVLYSLTITIFLKYLVISTFINERVLRISSIDLPLAATILVPREFIISYFLLIAIFFALSYTTMKVITHEFQKTFNNSPLEFVRNFVNFMDRGENLDRIKIENFFTKIGEERVVNCRFLYLDRGERNVVLIFPDIHPGPFEEIGGSNLPSKIQSVIKDYTMVFHTGTTHDDNASSTKEVYELSNKVREAIEKKDIKELSGFSFKRENDSVLIRFGNILWVNLIPAHMKFDDIYLTISENIRNTAMKYGFEDCIVVDAHNCHTPNLSPLKHLPQITYNINIDCDRLETGYYECKIDARSVGPRGIQALTIRFQNRIYAFLLIDGNNMIKGMREEIIRSLKGYVDDIEVFTSDNHFTNITTIDELPVGRDKYEKIIELSKEAVMKSIEDLRETRVYYGKVQHNMHVAGEGHMRKMGKIVMKAAKKGLVTSIVGVSLSTLIPLFLTI